MDITELRSQVRGTVDDPTLTYHQRMHRLALLAEDALEYPELSPDCAAALEKRIVCDMFEGHAPHRPRYLLPDYERALRQGSAYLELEPPQDLDDALWFLLTLYTHVPSITGFPVYLGDLDRLLEPFAAGLDDETLHRSLRRFWIAIDRVLPDAFVHANLGPDDTRVGRMLLRLDRELLQVVPNLTLRVDPVRTPDDLLVDAVTTVFETGKPHFVDHPALVADLGERYAAVSCYNSLPIGGGSHTLVRLDLREAVLHHDGGTDDFLADTLPRFVELTAELAEARIRHLVEQASFYEHSWLVAEGLLDPERFSAMFGIFGLAEAVELLAERDGIEGHYGHDPLVGEIAQRIVARTAELVAARPMPHCEGNAGRCWLHAQSGIDRDVGVTAGCRIPVGTEPALYEHIRTVAPLHHHFAAGISDILHFDDTARRNPQAIVDVIRGAFAEGMREFTFNLDSNGFIRITGYLVRKSDLAAIEHGARHASTFLGATAVAECHVDQRAAKSIGAQRIGSRERAAGSDR